MMENALPNCPVETTLTLISDKWKVLILRDLLSGTKRFSELKRSIGGVSQKVLTAQLRQMEASGLLFRTVPKSRVWGGSPTSIFAGLRPSKNFGCGHTRIACRLCAPLYMARKTEVAFSYVPSVSLAFLIPSAAPSIMISSFSSMPFNKRSICFRRSFLPSDFSVKKKH